MCCFGAQPALARCVSLLALLTGSAFAQIALPADPGPARFSFMAYGDSRAGNGCAGNAVHIALVKRMASEPASFVFHTGDMVTGYDGSTNWVQRGACPEAISKGSFKEIIAPLQSRKPAPGLPAFYFPVVGNHDDNWGDGWYPDKFGNGFCDVFDAAALVPNHTQADYFADRTPRVARYGNDEFRSLLCSTKSGEVYPTYAYYSFDFKNTHFVVLRVNSDYFDLEACNQPCVDPDNYDRFYNKHQLDWLRKDLASADGRTEIQHIVVLLHAPLFTGSWGHSANVSWPILSSEFSKHKVRLVISGHNHVYERSHPILVSDARPQGIRDDRQGTVYMVTGGGGSAVHGFDRQHPLMAVSNTEFHYLRFEVRGPRLSMQAVRPDGSVFDSFSLEAKN
jgi:hypothetical protein